MSDPYDLEKLRRQMQVQVAGKPRDPNEFVPAKAKPENAENPLVYRFYILPGLDEGQKCCDGKASRGLDGLFFIKNGNHFVNRQMHACPRILLDEECSMCKQGFDLLSDIPKEKKADRSEVSKRWIASGYFAVNLYFPASKANPTELHNRTLWYNAPKTVFDIWYNAINRNDGGDPTDPKAFGAVFNPNAAYLFQLEIKPNGGFNSYTTSKFLAAIGPHPLVFTQKTKEEPRVPDKKAIQAILDQRHDLWTKIGQPNPKKLVSLTAMLLSGADDVDEADAADAVEPPPKAVKAPKQAVTEDVDDDAPAVPAPKANGKKVPAKPAAIDEEGDSEETPAPAPVKAAKKPAAVATTIDDDEAGGSVDDETPAPAPAKVVKKPAAVAHDDDDTTAASVQSLLAKLRVNQNG